MSMGVIEMDAADRLILDEAAVFLPGSTVVVIGSAALAQALPDAGVHLDSAADELALAGRVGPPGPYRDLDPALLAGADLVLVRLPKSLDALDRIARLVALHASPKVVLVAGARIKYMSVGMNEVLSRSFGQLDVSLARQKSRVLIARTPLAVEAPRPARKYVDELGLWVAASGGVFAGASLDIGTRVLRESFDELPDYETAIDLGCGTGILAALLKRRRPEARVIASDASATAVESARDTMTANDLDVEVVRDAGLASQPDDSADLIVLNPPFHDGGAITKDIALDLFADAARVLRPGGELWTVWNSHLGYRAPLIRIVGDTRQISRTAKFTVTASSKTSSRLGMTNPSRP
jgi:16S rRNA (guanine1207-N2)-methyltransferase